MKTVKIRNLHGVEAHVRLSLPPITTYCDEPGCTGHKLEHRTYSINLQPRGHEEDTMEVPAVMTKNPTFVKNLGLVFEQETKSRKFRRKKEKVYPRAEKLKQYMRPKLGADGVPFKEVPASEMTFENYRSFDAENTEIANAVVNTIKKIDPTWTAENWTYAHEKPPKQDETQGPPLNKDELEELVEEFFEDKPKVDIQPKKKRRSRKKKS